MCLFGHVGRGFLVLIILMLHWSFYDVSTPSPDLLCCLKSFIEWSCVHMALDGSQETV
jgi:hypothetical protein